MADNHCHMPGSTKTMSQMHIKLALLCILTRDLSELNLNFKHHIMHIIYIYNIYIYIYIYINIYIYNIII